VIISATAVAGLPNTLTVGFDRPIAGGLLGASKVFVHGTAFTVEENDQVSYSADTKITMTLHSSSSINIGSDRIDWPDPTTIFDSEGNQVPGVVGFPLTIT